MIKTEEDLASHIERLEKRRILRRDDPWSLAKSTGLDDEYKSLIVGMANMLLSIKAKVDGL